MGGDEFICTISNVDLKGARERFEEIRGAFAEKGERQHQPGSRFLKRETRSKH
jgi:hypothetical protein